MEVDLPSLDIPGTSADYTEIREKETAPATQSPTKRKGNRGRPRKTGPADSSAERLITLNSSQKGYFLNKDGDNPPELENQVKGKGVSPQKRRRRNAKRRTPEDFLYGDLGDFSFLSKPKKGTGRAVVTKETPIPDSFFAAVSNSCAICGEEKEPAKELSSQIGEGDARTLRDCLSHLLAVDSRRLPQAGICALCLPILLNAIQEECALRKSVEKLRATVSSRTRYPLSPVNHSLEVPLKTGAPEPVKRRGGAFHARLAFNELKIKSNYKQEIGRAVNIGDAEKVANAVWKDTSSRKAILSLLQYKIAEEVNWFARKDSESWFRRVPDPDGEVDFEPEKALNELEEKAPLLFQIVGSAGIKSKVKFIGRKGGISEAIKLEWKKRYIPTLTGIFANILKLRDPGGCSAFQYYNTKILHDQGVGPKVLHILHKLGVTAAASTWRNLRKPGIAAQETDRQKLARVAAGQSTLQQLGAGARYLGSELMDDLDFAVPPGVESEDVEVYASIQFSEEEVLRAEATAVASEPEAVASLGSEDLFCELCNLLFLGERELAVHERARHGLSQLPGSFTSKSVQGSLDRVFGPEAGVSGVGGYGPIHGKPARSAPLPCVHCKRAFSDASNLKLHQLVDHAVKIQRVFYQCYECGRQFEDVKKLWSHIKVHTSEQRKEYNEGNETDRMELVEQDGSIVCRFCGKTFSSSRTRITHEQRMHSVPGTDETIHVCALCEREFPDSSQLGSHMEVDHPGVDILQDTVLVCQVCREQFADQLSLDSHMRMHIGEEELLCYECDINFTSQEERKAHFDQVHDQGKVFTCNLCGAEFSAREGIHEHLRVQHDRDTPGPPGTGEEDNEGEERRTRNPAFNQLPRKRRGRAIGGSEEKRGREEESGLVEVVDFGQPPHYPPLHQWAHIGTLD